MSLQPGDTLLNGQYRIERLLGRGGFGFVYLAHDTLLQEELALKELIPALVGDEGMLKRFLAEAKATMRLTHERIVRTHAVFAERGNYYIAMEYMAGGSLEARLAERGALPVEDAVHVAADVAEGLAYAHGRGVVHCDLKPANVLFTADGHAKVADFGIAHVPREMFSRSWATVLGFVAGTLPYMSPEQADGVRDDPRADLYALGAVLYRMLTGRTYLDFDERDTPGAQARNVGRIQTEQPQPPSSHNRRVPAWLDAVVLRALAKRPDERFATAGELLAALTRKGAAPIPAAAPPRSEGETVIVPPTARPAAAVTPARSPAPQLRWLWPAIAGTVGLLVIVVIALIASAVEGGRGKPAPTVTPVPPVSSAPTARIRVSPTPTLVPTLTPVPTVPPAPTAVPATIVPPPSATAVPRPTTTPAPSATPTAPPSFTVANANVNVRSGPGTVYPVIGALRAGQAGVITGRNAAGDWWQFDYNGQAGWVNSSVVRAGTDALAVAVVPAPPTPVATATPALRSGSTWTSPADGMVQVYVPAGEFLMGSADSDADAGSNEKPQHKVTLAAYWIDRTEVTKDQYQRCVAAGKCAAPACSGTGQGNHPVVCVWWQEAANYCAWAGRRLPTEAEWEKAARGTDGWKYPWGNEAPDCARLNYWGKDGGCGGNTTTVGSYPSGASPYGALDMAGNVWEWVADWYDAAYYVSSPGANPKGPDAGQYRVLRGGSWYNVTWSVRAAVRNWYDPEFGGVSLGFRCARSP